ncbi:MAG: SDR family NAD(P)-dependent oxidoreductase [Alphaproteobacteria bacterium]
MSRERRLEGRVALITGATSGIGRAIALRFAREGARVVCADRRERPEAEAGDDAGPPTHEVIRSEGLDARFIACDVTDGASVRRAIETTAETCGRLDIAVANAGIERALHDLPDEPFEDYKATTRVNQDGVWWTCREAVRQMLRQGTGGRIIATASITGLVGGSWGVGYAASKGATLQIVRTLAAQVAKHGITVNAICPGVVRTALTRGTRSDPARLAYMLGLHPLGRLGEPEDIAGAAFFLASDDARWVTGVALPVDGGYTGV